jgi:hypothetical protein
VLGAGLAQLDAHIDEPWSEAQPVGFHNLGIAPWRQEIAADRGDTVTFDQQIAASVEAALGVE